MALTAEARPDFTTSQMQDHLREHYGLEGPLKPLPAEWDQNFRLDCAGSSYVVKVANAGTDPAELDLQNQAMRKLSGRMPSGCSPEVVVSSKGLDQCEIKDRHGRPFRMRVLTYLEGVPLSNLAVESRPLEALGRAVGDLDRCLLDFDHPAMHREIDWDLRRGEWISRHLRSMPPRRRSVIEETLLQYRGRVRPYLADCPMSLIHNDANDENVLVAQDDSEWRIAGLLDFGDMLYSHTVNDPAIACAYAILGAEDPVGSMARVIRGYHAVRGLSEVELRSLYPLVLLRLCVSATVSTLAALDDPGNAHRQVSHERVWAMLEQLRGTSWSEAENHLRRCCGLKPRCPFRPSTSLTEPQVRDLRSRHLGPSLSLAYAEPLQIVRGTGTYLFDVDERAYLDCVNNVPHVGHCHPTVTAALADQAAVLNTNTRYLHPFVVDYARRLAGLLPDPLQVCFFVNSGSEANELALRMARTYTGRKDVIVLEDAYHGNTSALVEISPYKCEGPGGSGLPSWAHKVTRPDGFRGEHRGNRTDVGRAYAADVARVCGDVEPALFICESIQGCGGQLPLPPGYLEEAFRHVRDAGGLCVVDEVQVGFGRVGPEMWAFVSQGVVPDIVTLGKPIGNGHPLGAVVTTREIASSFANGMEFFSTFGGSPVSAAVGMAVLDVLESERLPERAGRVGRYLRRGFEELAERHSLIGDVRGLGMFLGVELVRSRETLEPAPDETSRIIEALKADGVLISAEGPHHNVLKIKPPLAFEETEADLLLASLDRALGDLSC